MPGAFEVKVNSAARTVSTVVVSGKTVTLTLRDGGARHGDTVTVSYTKPSTGENALQDHVGANDVVSFTDRSVTRAPAVANAIPDQAATVGEAFSYQFPENTFTDADGDTLSYTAAQSDGTALPGWLSFDAGTRTFSGTPAATDAGTVSVQVTASAGDGSAGDTFAIVVGAATVSGVAITSDPGGDLTYQGGDTIEVTVTFSGSVTVDTAGGTPRIALTLGTATRHAAYASGSPGTALVFSYKVASGDEATGGVEVAANVLEVNGGTHRVDVGERGRESGARPR